MRKVVARGVLILSAMLILVSSCSKKEESDSSQVEKKENLNVILNEEIRYLTPQFGFSTMSECIIDTCIYDTLVGWDSDELTYVPAVAESWEWVDDRNIKMNLRDDVIAADGSNITSEDVLFTFETGMSGRDFAAYQRVFNVKNFKIIDDYTIILSVNEPYPSLLEILPNQIYGIISKSSVEALGGIDNAKLNPLIGSGKYKFMEMVEGQYVKLERNEQHWDKANMPAYKTVTFSFVSDAATRSMAVESGDADVAIRLSGAQVEGLKNSKNAVPLIKDDNSSVTLFMNCSRAPYDDVRVRKAIFNLIDAEAIIKLMNSGFGKTSETNISPSSIYYKAPPAGFERKVDVEKARSLLAEAGYENGLEVHLNNVLAGDVTLAEMIQADLAKGGITADITVVESGTGITNMMDGNYDMYKGSIGNWDIERSLNGVDGRLPPMMALGGAQYKDEKLFSLIDAAKTEMDDAKRLDAYGEVQDYVRENAIVLGLCSGVSINAVSSDIAKIKYDCMGYVDIRSVVPAVSK